MSFWNLMPGRWLSASSSSSSSPAPTPCPTRTTAPSNLSLPTLDSSDSLSSQDFSSSPPGTPSPSFPLSYRARAFNWGFPRSSSPAPDLAGLTAPPPLASSLSTREPRRQQQHQQQPQIQRARSGRRTTARRPFERPTEEVAFEPLVYPDDLDDSDEGEEEEEDREVAADDPKRFERCQTEEGRTYYIDHHLKITSWTLQKPRKQTLRRKIKYVREQVLATVQRSIVSDDPREELCVMRVTRHDLFESAFEQIAQRTPQELRRKVVIHFEGEDGVDAGGLAREFFHLLSLEIANPNYGLFCSPSLLASSRHLLSINPNSAINPNHLDYFRIVGRIVGMALLNGERVGVAFAGVVWKLLVGGLEPGEVGRECEEVEERERRDARAGTEGAGSRSGVGRRRGRDVFENVDEREGMRAVRRGSRGSMDSSKRRKKKKACVGVSDLAGVDDDLEKNLNWVMQNDPSVLYRSFTHEIDHFGTTTSYDLLPNGEDIDVTEENKRDYVELVARCVLVESVQAQIEAMLAGMDEIVPRGILQTLKPEELELLICGISEIDVDDWQSNTEYRGGFYAHHPTVLLFWRYVRSLNSHDKTALLQFVTGSSRLPPGGFALLRSSPTELKKFTLILDPRPAHGRLPCAHTCFNDLDLPVYTTYEQIVKAMRLAVEETDGFAQQ